MKVGESSYLSTETFSSPQSAQARKIMSISQKTRRLLIALVIPLVAMLLWYGSFVADISYANSSSIERKADGIVVLTGEGNRIAKAIGLLKEKQGHRLLISGVNRDIKRQTLQNSLGVGDRIFNCCIDLDYLALDTKGNAVNTKYWADFHDFRSLIIVTSDYHIPRSRMVMHRLMPEVEMVAVGVSSRVTEGRSLLGIMLSPKVMNEFAKYALTAFGIEPAAKYLMTASRRGFQASRS